MNASGALASLRRLELHRNAIGDVGLSALANVVSTGGLPALQTLILSENQVGDQGMVKFLEALGKGALASLKTVVVDNSEHPALKAACKARGIGYWL